MKNLLKQSLSVLTLVTFATPALATNVNSVDSPDEFKAALMATNGGQWGGTYDVRYFEAVQDGDKNVYEYLEGQGLDGQARGAMDINFSVNPDDGLLSYVYKVESPSPSGTDMEVCTNADPSNPKDSSVSVRPVGEPLPRTILFKHDAINVQVAKARPQVEAAIKAQLGEDAFNAMPEEQRKAIVDAQMEVTKGEIEKLVNQSFSNANISSGLYSPFPTAPQNAVMDNEVIAVISGKKCDYGDENKSWDDLEKLEVPVIRAEIVDGVLQMRAVVSPYDYFGTLVQGFSIYEQTPGNKIQK